MTLHKYPTVNCRLLYDQMHSPTHIPSFVVELPVLDNELYHAVKPGLSAYKDNPEEVRMTVIS